MVRIGIGVHHAGLSAADRKHVEELFRNAMLPVLGMGEAYCPPQSQPQNP